METKKRQTNISECKSDSNRVLYNRPTLKIYGSVKVLTAGGLAGSPELNPPTSTVACDKDASKQTTPECM